MHAREAVFEQEESSRMALVKHKRCLTRLQMHAASPQEYNEFDT